MQVGEKTVNFDPDGFMTDPQLWDPQVAAAIAGEEGITAITDQHWKIINFIRDYWKQHDLAPPVRLICTSIGVNVREIYRLFTAGPARGACRVAGLPKPDGCV